jgi:hypothetical protein
VSDGAAAAIASTYSRSDDRISSGLSDDGTPLITFAPLLKGRTLPLSDILTRLLPACADGLASPVEIEFACDLEPGLGRAQRFHVLQLRPLVIENMNVDVELGPELMERALVRSAAALGHGRRETISDIVVIRPDRFDRAATGEAAMVIARINRALRDQGRQFILIGPGRWGSLDPWLGIPVSWAQISSVRVIVETDFDDLRVEPSLGSHFFHNLTCFGVAFFAAHQHHQQGWVNWPWFDGHEAIETALGGALRHLRLSTPAQVLVDGATGCGVILEGVG